MFQQNDEIQGGGLELVETPLAVQHMDKVWRPHLKVLVEKVFVFREELNYLCRCYCFHEGAVWFC